VEAGKSLLMKGAVVGLEQLKDALKGIPPEELENHLAAILQKMQEVEAARYRCEICEERPATVHITERGEHGEPVARNLCEECFREEQRR
jgi:hypothetical protein